MRALLVLAVLAAALFAPTPAAAADRLAGYVFFYFTGRAPPRVSRCTSPQAAATTRCTGTS